MPKSSLENIMPTTKVEVPHRNPQPAKGYGYHARALDSTDIDDIPEEEWDIVAGAPAGDYQYRGQRQLDSATCNVWYCGDNEGFFAQVMQGA